MNDQLHLAFDQLLQSELLQMDHAHERMHTVYMPLAKWISQRWQQGARIIGVNGAQGSGKSTLSKILAMLLQHQFELKVAVISLDDFYLGHQTRQHLAKTVHPLLQTRGVPGTHDVALAMTVIDVLKSGGSVALPQFDKGVDDCLPANQWPVSGHVDIVLFEGWCVAARPQAAEDLMQPVNRLESEEDKEGVWRRYVNQVLMEAYLPLFGLLDVLIMLKVPDFTKVYEWRGLQEAKLRRTRGETTYAMDEAALRRFIMHYERLTRHMLTDLPSRADVVLHIDEAHQISQVEYRS